jgi:translation elongation factor EF-4
MVEILLGRESSGKNKKKGKKRMKMIGKIEIPQEALLAALQIGEE